MFTCIVLISKQCVKFGGDRSYGLNVCVPQNLYVEPLSPKWWYWVVGPLITSWGITALREETLQRRALLPFPLREDTEGGSCLWIRKKILPRHWNCWGFDLGLPSLQTCEKHICVMYHHLVSVILQWSKLNKMAAQYCSFTVKGNHSLFLGCGSLGLV